MTSTSRVAVVTGSNKGIGFAIVKSLCTRFDGAVYLTSRDEVRGRAAVEQLKKLGLNPQFHQLDIDDEASIIRLRNYLKENYGGLDVLVNNAAIFLELHSSDIHLGVLATKTLRTNFFNTLTVCNILFPLLRPHARVVNMSSAAGHLTCIEGDTLAANQLKEKLISTDLTNEELCALIQRFADAAQTGEYRQLGWNMEDYVCYKVSKIALTALTRIQQRLFDKDARYDLIVNAVHPGFVETDMTGNQGVLNIDQGANAPSWLALLPHDTKDIKGAYVWHDKTIVDWINGPLPN